MTLRRLRTGSVCGAVASALAAASDGLQVRGVNGQALALFAPKGPASAIFFVATDCPISNWYAPTIQQVCRDYAARGVDCTLVYEDVDLGADASGARRGGAHASARVSLRRDDGGRGPHARGGEAREGDHHAAGRARRPRRRDPLSRPHRQRLCRSRQAAPARDVARSARRRSTRCLPAAPSRRRRPRRSGATSWIPLRFGEG